MKQKYLAVALSTALVASLTACGSDNKSNYAPNPIPNPIVPDNKPDPKPDPKPGDKKPEGTTPDTGLSTEANTIAQASKGGDLADKASVGTQHYIRNSLSEFDTTVNPNFNSTGSVANFDTLSNRQMANIVVARTTPQRVNDRLDIYVGIPNNNRQDPNALQVFNTQDIDLSNVSDNPTDNNGLVALLSGAGGVDNATVEKLTSNKALHTDIDSNLAYRVALLNVNVGKEETQLEVNSGRGSARIFGTNFHGTTARPLSDKDDLNNIRVYVGNALANKRAVVGNESIHSAANLELLTTPLTLNEVQFGRVTTNLENVRNLQNSDITIEVNGRKYFGIDTRNANTYLNVGRNNSVAVNNYFYRGTDESNLLTNAQTGTANYQGQALMYGIDNTYRGVGRGGGNSNAIVAKVSGVRDMLGNFVEARVDFANKKVVGDVYNVWRMNEVDASTGRNKIATAGVVKFEGDITGPNSVWGTAQRTYDTVNPVVADFQANFFGENAEEMGGSFNSVRRDDRGVARYGDATWGGVFGAQKINIGSDGYTTE